MITSVLNLCLDLPRAKYWAGYNVAPIAYASGTMHQLS